MLYPYYYSTVGMMRSEQTMTVRRGVQSGEGVRPVADDEGVMKTGLQPTKRGLWILATHWPPVPTECHRHMPGFPHRASFPPTPPSGELGRDGAVSESAILWIKGRDLQEELNSKHPNWKRSQFPM